MATLVIQSAPPGAPRWLQRCLQGVRDWASRAGFDYRCAGDELFERLPRELEAKTRDRRQVASDLARLLWISEALQQGWSAVVWLDADVLVVDPSALSHALDLSQGSLFGREVWIQQDARGGLRAYRGVHNALCAFTAESPFRAFYLDAAQRVVREHEGAMVPQLVGPKLLTALDNLVGLPATWAVNMASPLVVADIAAGGGPALARWLHRSEGPPAAINLCHSYAGAASDGIHLDEALLDRSIERCLRTPELVRGSE